jgi:hypothetical protein
VTDLVRGKLDGAKGQSDMRILTLDYWDRSNFNIRGNLGR